MPKAIEPQRTADDFIDWLRVKTGEPSSSDSMGDPDIPTQTLKRVDNHPARPVVWGVLGVGVGIGIASCFMSNVLPPRQVGSDEPGPAPTITVTQQVIREVPAELPEPCKNALTAMQKYLESAAKITSANNVQLDIMSDAYRAIVTKNWKLLNETEDRQRKLERSISDPTVQVMRPYESVKSELDQCLAQLGRQPTTGATP